MSSDPPRWKPTMAVDRRRNLNVVPQTSFTYMTGSEPPLPQVGDPVLARTADGDCITLYVTHAEPRHDGSIDLRFGPEDPTADVAPVEHEHIWVEVTDLADQVRREQCAVPGCDGERWEQRG